MALFKIRQKKINFVSSQLIMNYKMLFTPKNFGKLPFINFEFYFQQKKNKIKSVFFFKKKLENSLK